MVARSFVRGRAVRLPAGANGAVRRRLFQRAFRKSGREGGEGISAVPFELT